ncbi:MAG: hypothetical protein LBU32_12725 [Clostridiales bacterium]|jgi:hypothetical protein|nr:hypothetical protein [Clostridiales bacterium]
MQAFRDSAFMGIMLRAFCNRLKEGYPNADMTYGYAAKNTRIRKRLEKDNAVDARLTGGNPTAVSLDAACMRKAAG